ncbi:MAG: NUDIX domain-containing protein [Desulfarculales bacterium]|jgi:isopentenyldiphosphate isomerase|nr:NUDIX domain-containing protein [Desulfarculales bacterium]
MNKDLGKLLPVVNRQDQELGLEFRKDIHRLGLMHRTVHVLVFDKRGRLYLQKRSMEKDNHPGLWTSSAGGHVESGESYLRAAYRELYEELNLILPCRYLGILSPQPATDHAFAKIYGAVTYTDPAPDPAEISEGAFFSKSQAWRLALQRGKTAPVLRLLLALAGRRGRPFGFGGKFF